MTAEEVHTNRISRAEREADQVEDAVPVTVGDPRRTAMRRGGVRHAGVEPQRSFAAVNGDAIRPVVRSQEIGNAVVVEIAHVFQFLAEAALQQSFRRESAVPAIGQQRECAQLVDVIAGGDDLRNDHVVYFAEDADDLPL